MAKETLGTNSKLYNFILDIIKNVSRVVSFSRRGLTVRTADSKSARVGSTPTASAISF